MLILGYNVMISINEVFTEGHKYEIGKKIDNV